MGIHKANPYSIQVRYVVSYFHISLIAIMLSKVGFKTNIQKWPFLFSKKARPESEPFFSHTPSRIQSNAAVSLNICCCCPANGRRLRFLLTLTLQQYQIVQQSSSTLSAVTPTNPNFVSDKSLKNQIFDKDFFYFTKIQFDLHQISEKFLIRNTV